MASGWALVEARSGAQTNRLVKEAAEDFTMAEGRAAARAALQGRFRAGDFNAVKETGAGGAESCFGDS